LMIETMTLNDPVNKVVGMNRCHAALNRRKSRFDVAIIETDKEP